PRRPPSQEGRQEAPRAGGPRGAREGGEGGQAGAEAREGEDKGGSGQAQGQTEAQGQAEGGEEKGPARAEEEVQALEEEEALRRLLPADEAGVVAAAHRRDPLFVVESRQSLEAFQQWTAALGPLGDAAASPVSP